MYRKQQNTVIKAQDSTYHSEVNKAFQQDPVSRRDQLLTEQKRKEEKERQQRIVRMAAGVLLFIVLAIGIFRKKKPQV